MPSTQKTLARGERFERRVGEKKRARREGEGGKNSKISKNSKTNKEHGDQAELKG